MPIDLIVLSAAWLSGLAGGVHCVAMCGGIATGLPHFGANSSMRQAQAQHALLLNFGRIAGYAFAGALAGGLGRLLLQVLHVDGVSTGLRSLVGLVMVVAAVRLQFPTRLGGLTKAGGRLWARLQPMQRRLVPIAGPWRPLVLGLFWGWLPCGLSTTMLTAAWLEASAAHGALLMLSFGLGTLPLMTVLSWSGAHFARRLNLPMVKTTTASVIAAAGLLTLFAPWLVQMPQLHVALSALGCRALEG